MSEQANKTVIRPDTSNYKTGRAASGAKTMNNGDPVAVALEGLNLDEVKEVAEAMGIEDVNKYDHLNVGQRRMALGNRIRGRRKAIEVANKELEAKAEAEGSTAADRKAAAAAKDFDVQLEAACKGPHKARDAREKEAAKKAEAKTKAA